MDTNNCIVNKYNNLKLLRNWWFTNKRVWFDSIESDDIEISNKFSFMFDIEWDENILNSNIEYGIGYIILHDQIIRHFVRAKKIDNDIIQKKLNKIVIFVKKFYFNNKNLLLNYDFCFGLLPLRHTNEFENQKYVINETWEKILQYKPDTVNLDEQNQISIYKNYLKASYDRASKGNIYLISNENLNEEINIHLKIEDFISNFLDILDPSCHNYITNNNYLNRDKIIPIIKLCEEFKKKIQNSKIILSISGGVDSIVLSWIFSILEIDFIMVHINYANRGIQCEKEKEFLKLWSNYLGIKLYIRDIYEIKRSLCMEWDLRNLYETYTRDVRYNTYIQVSEILNLEECIVVLGHNHDDCVENILTNIANKTKYENLYGMDLLSEINFNDKKISFARPILSVIKSEIYEYAHLNNIPYLFDSTPEWSQRGQIRDIIRPNLIKWNKSSINGLIELSDTLKSSIECVDLLVDSWINRLQNNINESNYGLGIYNTINKFKKEEIKFIKININELKSNKIFWNRFLIKINFNCGSKILDEYMRKINMIKNKFNSIQINQINQIQFLKLNKIIYWKTDNNYLFLGFIK